MERPARTEAHGSVSRTVARHVAVGVALAWLSGPVEVLTAWLRGARPDALAATKAALHIAALLSPFGFAVGLALGFAAAGARRAPGTSAALRRVTQADWTAAEPGLFAALTATALTAGGWACAVRALALHFATAYHDAGLAAWAMAAVTLATLPAAVLVGVFVAVPLRLVARPLGRAASLSGFLVACTVTAAGIASWVFYRSPRLLHVLDWPRVLWGPGVLLAYVVALPLAVWMEGRFGQVRPLRRLGILAAASLLAFVGSAATYGASNAVRTLIEQRGFASRSAYRVVTSALDRDGDGHAFGFGGGDCDDSNPAIHPGAIDVPGDGVDSDCFHGDAVANLEPLGDGGYASLPEGMPKRPNFLIIGIDALRPDHLGAFGYKRETSPRIDAFAKTAVAFDDVVAQSSRSVRSIPAMWTGLEPSAIAYGPEYLYPSVLESNRTVPEVLEAAGYRTAVSMGTNYFARVGHFFQGFDDVEQTDDYKPSRTAATNTALRQLKQLQAGKDPWLLWVHLFHVHEPYLPDSMPSRFGSAAMDKYDTEIRLADDQFGRLLDAIDGGGASENTVVVLFSDHGEAFGEHQNRGHSFTLYEEELRATLAIRAPGVSPRHVRAPVALYDVAPTLLNLAGLPMPTRTSAESLVPAMLGDSGPKRPRAILSELMPDGMFPFDQKSIRVGNDKLIWWVREGTYQLYDLAKDPRETRDLSDARRARATELLDELKAWMALRARPDNRVQDVIDAHRLQAAPEHMTNRLDRKFAAGFTLLGYDMPKRTFHVGDRIKMTFYYRVDEAIRENLLMYVDLVGANGYRVHDFHARHYPLNGMYRTYEWRPGEVLADPVEIVVPKEVRRPVSMRIDFAVTGKKRTPVPFTPDASGRGILDLGQISVK